MDEPSQDPEAPPLSAWAENALNLSFRAFPETWFYLKGSMKDSAEAELLSRGLIQTKIEDGKTYFKLATA